MNNKLVWLISDILIFLILCLLGKYFFDFGIQEITFIMVVLVYMKDSLKP